jgi:hypothetical protein
MAYINYNSGSKVLFTLFVIFGTLGFISFIGLIVYDVGLEKINDKIVQHRINKNKRERKLKMILKAKCHRCNTVCTCEYNGDKSEDDLYYSNEPFKFECNNRSCRPSYQYGGPYSFIVPAKDIEFVKE